MNHTHARVHVFLPGLSDLAKIDVPHPPLLNMNHDAPDRKDRKDRAGELLVVEGELLVAGARHFGCIMNVMIPMAGRGSRCGHHTN